jgi:hypothetical protein
MSGAFFQKVEIHPLIAFLLENPSNSELRELPEVIEILLRNPQWVIREIDRCAYGRREKKPTKILTNRSAWTNVPEHQGEETRHGSEEGREVRERAKRRSKTR